MKTLVFSLILLMTLVSVSEAQTEKGRWVVGTQVGNFIFRTQDLFTSFSVNLTPSAGYLVANGLVVGAGLPISVGITRSGYGGDYYNRSSWLDIGLAPFLRYYVGQSSFKPYVGVAYSYSRVMGTVKSNLAAVGYNTGDTKGYATAFTPTLGIAYFINRSLALTAGLNYTIDHSEQTTTYSLQPSSSEYISKDRYLSLTIGFQLFIGK